jgi:hypothetical protein
MGLKLWKGKNEDLSLISTSPFSIASDEQPVLTTELESSSSKKDKIVMQTHSSWANWFVNHKNSDKGHKNIQIFSDILSSGDSNKVKLQALVKDIDTVILAADSNNNIMILHSPKTSEAQGPIPKTKLYACSASVLE